MPVIRAGGSTCKWSVWALLVLAQRMVPTMPGVMVVVAI